MSKYKELEKIKRLNSNLISYKIFYHFKSSIAVIIINKH